MHHRAAVSKKLSITIDYIHNYCVEQGLVKDQWLGNIEAQGTMRRMDGMGTSVTLAPAWEPMVGGELHRICYELHEFLLHKITSYV